MRAFKFFLSLFLLFSCMSISIFSIPVKVNYSQSAKAVEVYDLIEITLNVDKPDAINPFIDVTVKGEFITGGASPIKVDGFCDSDDGSIYRIRFMPSKSGKYTGSILFQQGDFKDSYSLTFTAIKSNRRGPVRVDRDYPFHFVWEGTGEHYFWNSTTCYALVGWRDDAIIRESIDRMHKFKINRIRAAIFPPRVASGNAWIEPTVQNDNNFSFLTNPWPASSPDSVDNPGYDISRFNIDHWQKYERLVKYANERDFIISAIFYVDGRKPGNYPFRENPAGEDEKRYYRYAIARLASFSNIMWDVSNEYNLFLDEAWAEKMGAFLKECDPYDHVTSIHHAAKDFNFRTSPWVDFASYQQWDENGAYEFMLHNREVQVKTDKPMPQVNEEYGYEDHYPTKWGGNRQWPARTADNRRRLAWEMTMAGAYQSTGERANVPGYGGWITGRGNDEMVMLIGYAYLRDFFETIPWWRLEPDRKFADNNALCLAETDKRYILYLPKGGMTKFNLNMGGYSAKWYNPRNGTYTKKTKLTGGQSNSVSAPDTEDWVFIIEAVTKK